MFGSAAAPQSRSRANAGSSVQCVTAAATPAEKRPAIVTVLAVIAVIYAVILFATTAIVCVLAIRPGEAQTYGGQSVGDGFWWMLAGVSLILALIYLWVARGYLAGNSGAWILVNVIALVNLFFSLFLVPIGSGWGGLVVNAVILILNNTSGPRIWFQTAVPYDSER